MKIAKGMKKMNGKNGKLLFLSVIVGGVVGSLDTIFGRVLLAFSHFRESHFLSLIWFLPVIGALFTYFLDKYGKNSQGGMGLFFLVGEEEEQTIPLRMIPFVVIGTWLTHLFGGSAGREGVAVQLGGTVAHRMGRLLRLQEMGNTFVVIGMAAGFAGLFQTPIAATFFALEVLVVGKLKYEALVPALLAAFIASQTSSFLGLEKFSFPLATSIDLNGLLFIKLVLLGLIFGWCGGFFAHVLETSKTWLKEKISAPVLRIFLGGIVLVALLTLFYQGRYAGLGTNLIDSAFSGDKMYAYDWLLKMFLTILTISVGFLGGEVTPLFAIGASLGVVCAPLFGLPVAFVAALGYASVFGSATSTFIAPIMIGCEVFGFQYLPFFFIVNAFSYYASQGKSIYSLQKSER
ncbi:chloride channel protein [Enterococcus sp. LJL98]